MAIPRTLDWEAFILAYPGMRLRPRGDCTLAFEGSFAFKAVREGHPDVDDSYDLSIIVPEAFPRALPVVAETAGRIPSDGKHHINQDRSLCLGARLRLLIELAKKPTLMGYAERCLVPYLYAMSLNLNFGIPFAFGELDHGSVGELKDYIEVLGLQNIEQTKQAVALLGVKERNANKHACPCGCGRRLGACRFRNRLNRIRQLASLEWFRVNAPK